MSVSIKPRIDQSMVHEKPNAPSGPMVNGQQPVLDASGEMIADAIVVATEPGLLWGLQTTTWIIIAVVVVVLIILLWYFWPRGAPQATGQTGQGVRSIHGHVIAASRSLRAAP